MHVTRGLPLVTGLFSVHKNSFDCVQLILTATTNLVATKSLDDLPEKTDRNERRAQRRFVLVLDYQSITIETPRRNALLFNPLVLLAAIKQQLTKLFT